MRGFGASCSGLGGRIAAKYALPSGPGMDIVSALAASERCVLAASQVASGDATGGNSSKSGPWSGTRVPGVVALTAGHLFSNTDASELILLAKMLRNKMGGRKGEAGLNIMSSKVLPFELL